MLIQIDYNPLTGKAFADGLCRDTVNEMVFRKEDISLCTSSSLIIDWLRVSLKNELISLDEIILTYKGEEIKLNANGKFANRLPKGFLDEQMRVLAILARTKQ